MSDTFSADHLFAAANRGSVRTLDLLIKSAGIDVSIQIFVQRTLTSIIH
jgi:hypothetical protein